jgi:hypothetical protein
MDKKQFPEDFETLSDAISHINLKIGKNILSDQDLIFLTCLEISKTFTYEEKGYLRKCWDLWNQ